MNHELFSLIRGTGYLSGAPLTDQQRYDLLTADFWQEAGKLGYDRVALKRLLWRMSGHSMEKLIAALPEAPIQKAARSKEDDPRKKIKATALAIARLYQRGEAEIEDSISRNLGSPDKMRAEVDGIRRMLLAQAASWLNVAVPDMYLAGSKADWLHGPHAKAAQAMAAQEFNRFKEVDAQIGRHVEEVIAESEMRRTQAALSEKKVDYTGLKGRIIGHKTIDGKELNVSHYIVMLAITAARNLFNLGVENSMLADGNDLAMISPEIRTNSCGPCRQWAGKIISMSGKSKDHPSYEDAKRDNVFHPHCIHYLIPR